MADVRLLGRLGVATSNHWVTERRVVDAEAAIFAIRHPYVY
jgi:hypothetical protein